MADQEQQTTDPRMARWETDAGPVLLIFPAAMTVEDVAEVEEFVALQLRVIRRIAEAAREQ